MGPTEGNLKILQEMRPIDLYIQKEYLKAKLKHPTKDLRHLKILRKYLLKIKTRE